ncbi:MAG TPA: glycosyltransferase family 1 protein [Xanthomonadaceae bacterium]|jgi:glycosyltransferase involved in cell wall biosynthesis
MRYAIVTETYPPEVNGVALTVQALENGLRSRGHDVSLVRPRQSGELVAGADQMLVRGAPLPRYPGLRFGLPAGRALHANWKRQRPDAIYVATEGPLGWSAVRTARRLGIPVTTGLHTRFDEYVERYGAAFLTPIAFAWMRRFHNTADATIVPTEDLAMYLRRRGFNDVRVLRRAVDSQLFDPARRDAALRASWGVDGDGLVVMYLGRIAAEKNLDLAIRAFRAIQAQQPQAHFVWVGEGPVRATIEKANPDFVFAGLRRGEELARHFASADLFLFPSLTETFGNVTLEAMASGVPTVAFDYGAAHDHLRDGVHGATVRFGDHEAFARAAVHIAGDARMRRAMAAQARQAVTSLSPESVTRHFDMLLSSLPSRRRAA